MVTVKSPKVQKSKNGSIFKMFTSVVSRLLNLLVLGIWVTKSVLPRTGFLNSRWILSFSWVLLRKVSLWNVSKQNKYSKRIPFFLKIYFVLEYSQLTMLWQFQVDTKGTQPYIYMYPYVSFLPSHSGCHRRRDFTRKEAVKGID